MINMEHLINPRVKGIEVSGIRKFANLVANHPDAISLTIGQPDFPTPEHVKAKAKIAIDENKTTYTPNAGLLELRKAVSRFMEQKYNLTYNPNDEIIITNGASEALDISLRTILSEGDEVILPAPVYPGYEPLIRMAGAIPVHIDTRNHGFKLNASLLKERITGKTRCIILPYPSNPTGCVMEEQELKEIADFLKDKELFIISDEIYSELIYGKRHHSISHFPHMREKTIVINGLSKSHSMTGWRIGFTCAPAYITKHMVKVHQYNSTCACTISQYAALEALTNGMDDALPMREAYQYRRDYVYERLQSMGLEVEKPTGAFYIFPSIAKYERNSFSFAQGLLEKEKVAVVPGSAFTEYGEGYIRISYAYSMEVLEKGLDRLERYLRRY